MDLGDFCGFSAVIVSVFAFILVKKVMKAEQGGD